MKNIKTYVVFVGFLVLVGLIGNWESKYTRAVTCIEKTDNFYNFMDESGNVWGWETNKDTFSVGDPYYLIMDDNHTPNDIFDDSIIKIKK